MWKKSDDKIRSKLLGLKKIKINGLNFTIKQINPLIDFPSDQIPQIFTDYSSIRKPAFIPNQAEYVKKVQSEMFSTITAGVVEPELVPVGKKGGISADDLFRDPAMGIKLYYEIIDHSLNRFKGLKRLFFWIEIKFMLLIQYAGDTVKDLQVFSSRKENLV